MTCFFDNLISGSFEKYILHHLCKVCEPPEPEMKKNKKNKKKRKPCWLNFSSIEERTVVLCKYFSFVWHEINKCLLITGGKSNHSKILFDPKIANGVEEKVELKLVHKVASLLILKCM